MSSDLRTILGELVKGKTHPGLAWDVGGVLVYDKAAAVGLCILTDETIEATLGPWSERSPSAIRTYLHYLENPRNMTEENAMTIFGIRQDVFRAARESALVDPVNLPKYLRTTDSEIDALAYAMQRLPPMQSGIPNVRAITTASAAAERALYNTIEPALIARKSSMPLAHYHGIGHTFKDDALDKYEIVAIREDEPRKKIRDSSRFYIAKSATEMKEVVDILAEILSQRERAA